MQTNIIQNEDIHIILTVGLFINYVHNDINLLLHLDKV